MRVVAILLGLVAASPALAAEVTIGFDDVPSTTVIDDHYADRGVTFTGLGNGGPFDVEAKLACVTTSSPPNAITLAIFGTCPEIIDTSGYVRVEFATPQPWVSVMVTHVQATTATYLRALDGGQFLDWEFGKTGSAMVGVPQKIEVTRDASARWITAVEFGAFRDSGTATFDDLHYAIGPVAAQRVTWSVVKSRF